MHLAFNGGPATPLQPVTPTCCETGRSRIRWTNIRAARSCLGICCYAGSTVLLLSVRPSPLAFHLRARAFETAVWDFCAPINTMNLPASLVMIAVNPFPHLRIIVGHIFLLGDALFAVQSAIARRASGFSLLRSGHVVHFPPACCCSSSLSR